MMETDQPHIELQSLVDILSNMAGMMILLACIVLLTGNMSPHQHPEGKNVAKPISFPLSYIPKKRSLTLCLRYGKLYELPEEELLQAVNQVTRRGKPVEELVIKKNGVISKIIMTSTATGFRFEYTLTREGGMVLDSSERLVAALDDITKRFPPTKFFFVFHTWQDAFSQFRDIREYLIEQGIEVGWMPRESTEARTFDVGYSIGEYDEDLSSIKAQ